MLTTRTGSLVADARSITRAALDLRAMSRRISQVAGLSLAVVAVLFSFLGSTAFAQSTTGPRRALIPVVAGALGLRLLTSWALEAKKTLLKT